MKLHKLASSILLILLGALACMADNYIIINQVMYDTPLNEKTSVSPYSNGEFVELYNAGSDTVSLQGWWIKGDGVSEVYQLPDIQLPNDHYLILACRRGANNTFQLSDLYTLPNDSACTIVYQNKIVLANSGETLTLCNALNDTVDQMYYDGTSHMSNPDRLYATNADSTNGDLCVSLHRSEVEFDSNGKVVPGSSRWQTDYVTFATSTLPHAFYSEFYITGNQSLPTGENYILTVTPLDPTSRISIQDGRVSVGNNVRVRSILQYFDGLGRSDESIALGATPYQQDLVTTVEYRGKYNVFRQWLPAVMQTGGQRMDMTTIHDQCITLYSDTFPFSEILYENSAVGRPIATSKPGGSYLNNRVAHIYNLNNYNDNVRIYSVNTNGSLVTNGTNYAEATLYKNTTSDEDGKSVIVYTDKQDRTIMIERDGNRTYYVYDDLGRLRFVLPNLHSSKLNSGTYNLNNSTLKAIAYCYSYDEHGNVVYKRMPGCEPQYIVYDQMGQLVLKQDSIQRRQKKWVLCAYDSIGRNLYTAEIKLPQDHSYYITSFADTWQVEQYDSNLSSTIDETGYTLTQLHSSDIRPLTVNYYDNYDFLNTLPSSVESALNFAQESEYGMPYDNAAGLLTGRRIYNLSEDSYTITAYYYDVNGRIVQSRGTRNAGGYAISCTDYLFDGSIAKQFISQGSDNNLILEQYRYTYDHAGRAKQVHYQLNNENHIILSEFKYDSLGHLVQNLLHNRQDTIKYSYDMRNMLTKIENKHFSERLFYADSLPQSVVACHNGNIAASRITHSDSTYTFAYVYDACNRLTESNRLTGLGPSYSEHFAYDDAGNLTALHRYVGSRLIDDLDYHYGNEGNRLLSITDRGQNADRYAVIEYHNSETATDTTMRYDVNGNLISDVDRGISAIRYNILNLPDTIQFINGNQIVNVYDAAGRKYKSITYINPATAVTPQYDIVHYTFETDTAKYTVEEYAGNIVCCYSQSDTTQRIFNSTGYYADSTFFHYIKDHLGNICAVINITADTLVQSTLYSASGVPMAQSFGRDEQPYLYNGKEFVESHGWNTYDYGFRGYYATIGRFTSPDPLAEQTPWLSPYSNAGNNYINNIDWMGLAGISGSNDYALNKSRFLFSSTFSQTINLTVLDDYGVVIEHIDNEDNSVMHDGIKIGTELDDENYSIGRRVYFKTLYEAKMKVYSFITGNYAFSYTPFERKVEQWLRAHHIDKLEDVLLDYSQPIIMELILVEPIVSQFNDAYVLIYGENIYGEQEDKALVAISLLTQGFGKLVSPSRVGTAADHIHRGIESFSHGKSIKERYETILGETP